MYLVIFKRMDKQPDEVYYYNTLSEARYHFNLFRDDDSKLYNRIELSKCNSVMQMQIDVLKFKH